MGKYLFNIDNDLIFNNIIVVYLDYEIFFGSCLWTNFTLKLNNSLEVTLR